MKWASTPGTGRATPARSRAGRRALLPPLGNGLAPRSRRRSKRSSGSTRGAARGPGEERAGSKLRDLELDFAGLGREQPAMVAVAVVRALGPALVRARTDDGGPFAPISACSTSSMLERMRSTPPPTRSASRTANGSQSSRATDGSRAPVCDRVPQEPPRQGSASCHRLRSASTTARCARMPSAARAARRTSRSASSSLAPSKANRAAATSST